MKVSQKTAVLNTITSTLAKRGVHFELNGIDPIACFITPEDRKKIRDTLFIGFRIGIIEFSRPYMLNDDVYLKNYISGLLTNWLKKAKELNCGQNHYYYIAA